MAGEGEGGWGRCSLLQIFVRTDLLPIDNDGEKKKYLKNELLQVTQKILEILVLSTSCNA